MGSAREAKHTGDQCSSDLNILHIVCMAGEKQRACASCGELADAVKRKGQRLKPLPDHVLEPRRSPEELQNLASTHRLDFLCQACYARNQRAELELGRAAEARQTRGRLRGALDAIRRSPKILAAAIQKLASKRTREERRLTEARQAALGKLVCTLLERHSSRRMHAWCCAALCQALCCVEATS